MTPAGASCQSQGQWQKNKVVTSSDFLWPVLEESYVCVSGKSRPHNFLDHLHNPNLIPIKLLVKKWTCDMLAWSEDRMSQTAKL